MKNNRQRRPLTQGLLSWQETLDQYGDMPLHDFADLAISYGLMPLPFLSLVPYDELTAYPQRQSTPTLSAQRELAS